MGTIARRDTGHNNTRNRNRLDVKEVRKNKEECQ